MSSRRGIPAGVFAGDRRVWRAAAVVAVPLIALVAYFCLRPQVYLTGTNDVEAYTYIAEAQGGQRLCVPGLTVPAGTGRIRLQLVSRAQLRPALRMALRLARPAGTLESRLAPVAVSSSRISTADFPIAVLDAQRSASLCVSATDLVNWGGTPLPAVPSSDPATVAGHPVVGRIAIWYLPKAGSRRSYLSQAGTIMRRASLFRSGFVGPALYWLILFVLLPVLAVASVRCLALAAAGRAQRLGSWLFAIAALNFACWALITPAFQAPDEVDHFAYTQSLVERGQVPSPDGGSPLPRWSSAESLALEDEGFLTDHQVGGTRPPWSAAVQSSYRADVSRVHPQASDGGGNETAATHGPIYYAALAPAYALASGSPFDQLTLMRLTSALIGALTVLFAFLLARELAPVRPWLAVLAGLLVAYEPMYGFISGAVNNDVGVNAAAAAVELLLIRMLRRGITVPWGVLTGALLIALPIVKGTGMSLYPVAALVFIAALWRNHARSDLPAWGALALGAVVASEVAGPLKGTVQPAAASGSATIASNAGAVHEALHHLPTYLSFLWQAVLPRLPFMSPHFLPVGNGFVLFNDPGFVIFVKRGWGAFGWYDVYFPHWVYVVICLAMIAAVPLGVWAARREWGWVRGHALELIALLAMPAAVIAGFEAAFYTVSPRPLIAEFGRYAFPAIAPLAVLVAGALHAFGRRWALLAGAGLLVAMVALSYAAQLLTLTSFYA